MTGADQQTSSGPSPVAGVDNRLHDRDEENEEARELAVKDEIQSWKEQLQLTSFFAFVEATILFNRPLSPSDWNNTCLKLSNAGLLCGLIMQVYAALLSFVVAFILIEYKLKDAMEEEEYLAEEKPCTEHSGVFPHTEHTEHKGHGTISGGELEHSGFPTGVLKRIYSACIAFSSLGLLAAIVGVVFYAWASQPWEVELVVTACAGTSVLTVAALIGTTIYQAL
ncbi:hypothetical protein ID866_679 [Astraeus odoratus]|nr:hypothetical protein ID866_679 [Astraeus odoratus]